MRSRTVVLLALLAARVFGADQPISNGSFEILGPGGVAVDWEHVGSTVDYSPIAHTGARSLRLVRTAWQTGETGLNRDWKINSGQRGAMLEQRQGALEFWYQVPRLDPGTQLVFYAIPMTGDPTEGGGNRRKVVASSRVVGDGQWHRAVVGYDFRRQPEVKWVHASVRIEGKGGGEALIDDVAWLPEAGPQPVVLRARVVPTASGQAELVATFTNAGDQPAGAVDVRLELPEGVTAGPAQGAVQGLAPDEYVNLTWPLQLPGFLGMRQTADVTVQAKAGELESEQTVSLLSDTRLDALLVDPAMPRVGETVAITALLSYRRPAGRGGEVRISGLPAGVRLEEQRTPSAPDPGDPYRTRYTIRYTFRADRAGKLAFPFTVRSEGEPTHETVNVDVRPAEQLRYQALAPGLEVAASPHGAVGRVVAGGQTIALLPHLGEVVLPGEPGPKVLRPTSFTVAGDTLTARIKDGAATWTFRLTAEPGLVPHTTSLASSVACDRATRVLAVRGPELLAVGRRDEALYPGLEWLAPGELSSHDYDIATDHPLRVRYVTHPNNVTVPLMAAATEHGVVGLLWDVHQQWQGGHDRPQPLFASPDRFEHVNATRMGLLAPNTLTGLEENTTLAKEPLPLQPGEPVRFEATVYADPAGKDVLDAQTAWFGVYQLEPIAPYPHGSLDAELAFSARAYLDSLWDPQTKTWSSFLLGPAISRGHGRFPGYAFDLVQLRRLAAQDPVAARIDQRLADLGPLPPRGEDEGYFAGDPLDQAPARIADGQASLGTREADFGWSYQPPLPQSGVFKGADYYELGAPGMTGNGLFARRLADLLLAARLVGDRETYRAAVPSLERLAQFHIPRAAQVWEVPVHTPDILAAADACEAFLEAYRLSGEPRWLEQAKLQARAGLPFVYVWGQPDLKWMRYGSIPVFGATWFRGPWFGRVVQWNGLRYARALLQLQPFDPRTLWGGLTWQDVALGIVVSAMYQQREDSPYTALWPDALGCRDRSRAGWEFAPRQILSLQYELMGRVEHPRTVVLEGGDTQPRLTASDRPHLTITAAAAIPAGSLTNPGRLSLTFAQPAAPAAVRATIAGLAEPREVRLDGRPAARLTSLAGDAPGWRYQPDQHALGLILPATARCEVTIDGVTLQPSVWRLRLAERPDFRFDQGADGWHAAHQVEGLRTEHGLLVARTTGGDPYLIRPACRIPADQVKAIRLRYRVSAGTSGQLFWTTAASPQFDEAKSLHFAVTPGAMGEVVIPVGGHPEWRGTITSLRLDPVDGGDQVDIAIESWRGE